MTSPLHFATTNLTTGRVDGGTPPSPVSALRPGTPLLTTILRGQRSPIGSRERLRLRNGLSRLISEAPPDCAEAALIACRLPGGSRCRRVGGRRSVGRLEPRADVAFDEQGNEVSDAAGGECGVRLFDFVGDRLRADLWEPLAESLGYGVDGSLLFLRVIRQSSERISSAVKPSGAGRHDRITPPTGGSPQALHRLFSDDSNPVTPPLAAAGRGASMGS